MKRYSIPLIAIHWIVALLIIGTFALGVTMVDIPGITPTKLKYYSWHKWAGITVLGLVCLRLLWRLKHGSPSMPATMKPWQTKAAHVMHVQLYLLMFAVPLSGYFYSLAAGIPVVYFGLFTLPTLIGADADLKEVFKQTHYALNMILLGSVILHLLAALKHHFIDRDGILGRMNPLRKP